ncbi:unnamed protein product [Gongylonema pulchrum]|uniref:Drf_GBD domain-containing protein n=1 Tax=Gongylonema pulchrum TaxID=637853 RepID=A0A183CUL1_9BILA|nr:unnamed protein product [Gongylonema pulchrum]
MIDVIDRALCCFNRILPEEPAGEKICLEKSGFKIDTEQNPVFTLERVDVDEREIDAAFPRLVRQLAFVFGKFQAELDLSPENQKMLLEQPIEKKWLMLMKQTAIREKYGIGDNRTAEEFAEILHDRNLMDSENSLRTLDALFLSLRTQSHSYVETFIRLGGIGSLRSLLNGFRKRSGSEYHTVAVLYCFRALLNSTVFPILFFNQ